MMNNSKKHHYNPRFVLSNFSIDGRGKQIWLFDKLLGESFPSSLMDAGSENWFNTFFYRGKTHNFEEVFQFIDDDCGDSIRRIHKDKTLATSNGEDISRLVLFVAVQMFRTKMQRTSMVEFTQQLADRLNNMGVPKGNIVELLDFGENEARIAGFRNLLGLDELAAKLVEKRLVLLQNQSRQPLWTSDNPVVMHNTFRFGYLGLDAKGIEIYLPIGPDQCLAFYCPSIHLQLAESFSPSHPRPPVTDPWLVELFKGMNTHNPVPIQENTAIYLNELQLKGSSRFIYGTTDEFDHAKNYLTARPEIRNVRTLFRLGNFGNGYSLHQSGPPGDLLVFHGQQNYFELQVFEVQEESIAFRFATTDDEKLQAIEKDGPFSRVEYFVDGHLRQSIGEATLESISLLNDRGHIQARIKHSDESLNRLFEQTGFKS